MKDLDENKKNLIKICLYGGFFLIVLLVLTIMNRTGNTLNSNGGSQKVDTSILEQIKNLDDNYYSSKVHLVMDDDAISLDYQKINEVEIGVKKYHGENTEYTKYNDLYYKLDNNSFTKLNDFVDFDFDKTFMYVSNLKKLLSLDGNMNIYNDKELKVLKIDYKINDVLKIYNEFNNIDIIKYSDGIFGLEIYYKDKEISYVIINATDLYNLINDKSLDLVYYKIVFKEEKEEDVSWLIEKLS